MKKVVSRTQRKGGMTQQEELTSWWSYWWAHWAVQGRLKLRETKGQGTTEYAILVGVLVVIAILAITVFRPKLQELWDAIASGINGL